MICRDTPIHGWVCGWLGGSVGQSVGLGLDVIEIIQFCLKIYDLLRYPHLWVGDGSMGGSMGGGQVK